MSYRKVVCILQSKGISSYYQVQNLPGGLQRSIDPKYTHPTKQLTISTGATNTHPHIQFAKTISVYSTILVSSCNGLECRAARFAKFRMQSQLRQPGIETTQG